MDDPALGETLTLQDLIEPKALAEVCRSFGELFGVRLHVQDRARPASMIAEQPGSVFRTADLRYDGEAIGLVVLGPYWSVDSRPPGGGRGQRSIDDSAADRLLRHALAILDVLLWNGHRSHLASRMQEASARESYRELIEKNRALRESLDRLNELDRLKSNFLHTISHELRTPLTSILGYAEMLAEGIGGSLAPEQLEFVRTIEKKGQSLLALVSDIIDLSRLDATSALVNVTEVDVCALCADLVEASAPQARAKNVTLDLVVQPEIPMILTDLERTRRILESLLDNAIKFTDAEGQVQVSVGVKTPALDTRSPVGLALLGPADQRVEITIADSGVGIPVEALPHIFDVFFQVDGSSTREFGGAGLGLSVVKRLTESLGGKVTVTSVLGAGSIFRVELPIERP